MAFASRLKRLHDPVHLAGKLRRSLNRQMSRAALPGAPLIDELKGTGQRCYDCHGRSIRSESPCKSIQLLNRLVTIARWVGGGDGDVRLDVLLDPLTIL